MRLNSILKVTHLSNDDCKTKLFLFSSLLLLLLLSENAASVPGQNLYLGNAKAISLGNAVTADPPGVDAIHFNPAGLSLLDGRQFELKALLGDARLEANFTPSDAYSTQLLNQGFSDPASNQKSKIENIGIYFGGDVIEIPFIVTPPFGGISFSPEDSKFTFGTSVYSPLIAGAVRNDNDAGRFVYREVGVTRITYFSPTVSMQVNPKLSVGLSLGFSYMGVGAKSDLRFPNAVLGGVESLRDSTCNVLQVDEFVCAGSLNPTQTLASIDLSVQDYFSPSFNIGVLWEPTDWLKWGMVYRSTAKNKLRGKLKVSYSEGVQDLTGSVLDAADPFLLAILGLDDFQFEEQEVDVTIDLDYPQHFSTGVSIQIFPDWKVNFDLKWNDTGVWESWVLKSGQPVDVLGLLGLALPVLGETNISGSSINIPRGYNSVWNWAIGIEHQFNNKLALRAGYEPQSSQIPNDRLGFIVPVEDMSVLSLGFSYLWKEGRVIEGAVSYINSSYNIPVNSSSNFNNEEINNFVYNPYTGHAADVDLDILLFLISYRAHW